MKRPVTRTGLCTKSTSSQVACVCVIATATLKKKSHVPQAKSLQSEKGQSKGSVCLSGSRSWRSGICKRKKERKLARNGNHALPIATVQDIPEKSGHASCRQKAHRSHGHLGESRYCQGLAAKPSENGKFELFTL